MRYRAAMKIEITLPAELGAAVDALAERLGLTPSELITRALSDYLTAQDGTDVTDRLNEVYAREESRLPYDLRTLQSRTLRQRDA